MNPIAFAMRRPVTTLMLVVALVGGGVLGLSNMRAAGSPPHSMSKNYASLDFVGASAKQMKDYIVDKFESYFHKHEEHHQEHSKIVVTSPAVQDVLITESFVCQIRSQRHIEVRALDGGYLKAIQIKEGQAVKEGDLLFKILPVLFEAKLEVKKAEAKFAQMEYEYAKQLVQDKVVAPTDMKLHEAKLLKANAEAKLAERELNFTEVRAPFNGIVDRLLRREGSLINEGDMLTTMSDNSVMWVYFNVPEKYYLEYMANRKRHEKEDKIELVLANGDTFPQTGTIGAIEADFNNENGNIKFRADYPNPDSLLRNGQTGTIKIRRPSKNALVIPQRATFELLDKRYVWVVDENDVAHQTLITTEHELEDIFVIKSGLNPRDKIIVEGVRDVEERGKVVYDFLKPEEALKGQKFHAE